jgi:hypothetical protein
MTADAACSEKLHAKAGRKRARPLAVDADTLVSGLTASPTATLAVYGRRDDRIEVVLRRALSSAFYSA